MKGKTMVEAAITLVPAQAAANFEQKYEPSNAGEAWVLAQRLHVSGLLPRHVQSPEAAFAIIVAGAELSLTAMQSLRSLHFFEGGIKLPAALIVARVKTRNSACEYFQLIESSASIATYETKRKGNPSPTRMSFTIEDAQRAGLVGKDNWKKYPAAMLIARASSALARAEYPESALGLYAAEEIDDEDLLELPRAAPTRSAKPSNTNVTDAVLEPATSEGVSEIDDADKALHAQQLLERIRAAASVEELTSIARELGSEMAKPVPKRRLTQAQAKTLRDQGGVRRRELAAATKAQAEATEFAGATSEAG